MVTMPRRTRLPNSFLFLLLWLFAAAGLRAQTAPVPLPAQQAGPAATPQSANKETQQPLDVDRDPVASPDEEAGTAAKAPAQPAGQNPKTQKVTKENGEFLLHREVNEVLLNVTVIDDKQRLVTSLGKGDFKVYEDGVLQTITAYKHEDQPVSLGILVDDSGSMQPKHAAVAKAALDLVRLSNPQDETFIVNFADEPYLDQDFTSDLTKLNDGLTHIEARGGTALYDAVSASADHMAKTAKRSRQVLLIITDGEDNDSASTLEETVRRVQDLGGPVVYAIGLLFGDTPKSESRPAKRALDLLAKETGGVAYFPKSLADIDDMSAQVARDIRNQYVLGYHSTKPPEQGGFRTVRVEVTAKGYGKLSARTRTGYYPESEASQKPAGKPIAAPTK
jgi:Ca-activated chloride channel homolog